MARYRETNILSECGRPASTFLLYLRSSHASFIYKVNMFWDIVKKSRWRRHCIATGTPAHDHGHRLTPDLLLGLIIVSDPTLPGTTIFGAYETRHFGVRGTWTQNLLVTSLALYHSATAVPVPVTLLSAPSDGGTSKATITTINHLTSLLFCGQGNLFLT